MRTHAFTNLVLDKETGEMVGWAKPEGRSDDENIANPSWVASLKENKMDPTLRD